MLNTELRGVKFKTSTMDMRVSVLTAGMLKRNTYAKITTALDLLATDTRSYIYTYSDEFGEIQVLRSVVRDPNSPKISLLEQYGTDMRGAHAVKDGILYCHLDKYWVFVSSRTLVATVVSAA